MTDSSDDIIFNNLNADLVADNLGPDDPDIIKNRSLDAEVDDIHKVPPKVAISALPLSYLSRLPRQRD